MKPLKSLLIGSSQDTMQLGGEKCLEKNYYKCGCTEEVRETEPINTAINLTKSIQF